MREWKNGEVCKQCGRTDYKHTAFGLCDKCYRLHWRSKELVPCACGCGTLIPAKNAKGKDAVVLKEHEAKYRKKLKLCAYCGMPLKSHKKSKYCSDSCRDKAREKRKRKILCTYCGKEFSPSKEGRKFCSRICSNRFIANDPEWKAATAIRNRNQARSENWLLACQKARENHVLTEEESAKRSRSAKAFYKCNPEKKREMSRRNALKPERNRKLSETAARRAAEGKMGLPKQHHFKSKKAGNVSLQSKWEVLFAQLLDNHPDVLKWSRPEIVIHYFAENEKRKHYVPDFLIHLEDNSTILLEIKSGYRRYRSNLDAKIAAAKAFCAEKGWQYVLLECDHKFNMESLKTIVNYHSDKGIYWHLAC